MTDTHPKLYEKILMELNNDVLFTVEALTKKYEMDLVSFLPYIHEICNKSQDNFVFNEKKGTLLNMKLLEEATQMIDDFGEETIKIAVNARRGNQYFGKIKELRNEFSEKLDRGKINAILYVIMNAPQFEPSFGLMVTYLIDKAIDLGLNYPFYRSIILTLDITSQGDNPAIHNRGLFEFVSNLDQYILHFLDTYGYKVGLARNINFLFEYTQKLTLLKKFPGWNLVKNFQKKYAEIIEFVKQTLAELCPPAVSLMKIKPGYRVVTTFKTFESEMHSITWASHPPLLEISGGEWVTINTVRAVFDKKIVLKEPRIGQSRARSILNSTANETIYTLSLVMLEEFVQNTFGISNSQIRRRIPVKQVLDRFGVEMGINLGWFEKDILPCFYPDLIFYLTDDKLVFARYYEGRETLPYEGVDQSNKELMDELKKTGEYEFGGDTCLDFFTTEKGEKVQIACISLMKFGHSMTGFITRKPEDSQSTKEANERFIKLLSNSL